ncbi:MAG: hypothetical protein OXH67_03050 [Acidimicrobiaceae bacterium]|nr:hypothetical protein [Acidimicrobiaceae bacterium]
MALHETIERIRSSPVPPNEETAKLQILAPILQDLGWNPFGPEILWEHSVGETKGGGRVDIALTAKGRIRALIEAKAPGADLSNHVKQVLGYAFEDGVDICVLSDGLQWWLYLPQGLGSPKERRFAVLHVDKDPLDQVCNDLTTFLGRDSLVSGQAQERAKQVREALREAAQLEKEMPEIWRGMLDEPDSELIELFGERVYEKLSLRPSREQVVAAMRNTRIPPKPTDHKPAPPPASKPPIASPAPRPIAVRLWDQLHPVKAHYQIMMTVVEELYLRHGDQLANAVEKLGSGKYRYASHDPAQVLPRRVKQTPSGLWVDINLSAQDVRKRTSRLLQALGHDESDLVYLYE